MAVTKDDIRDLLFNETTGIITITRRVPLGDADNKNIGIIEDWFADAKPAKKRKFF